MHFLLPGPRVLAYPANLLGLLPLAVGVYLNLAADRLLKRYDTTVKPFQESTALLTTGVFGHTRNPMYIRAEETMLRDRFGDEWVAYQTRVRKWL